MTIAGTIVVLFAAQSFVSDLPAAWSTGDQTVSWTDVSRFPFAWYQDESTLVFLDAEGTETNRWSVDTAIGDPTLRLLDLAANDDGTLFAVWTRAFDPTLSAVERAIRLAKGVDATRVIVLDANGDRVFETRSHHMTPSILLIRDRFLVYVRAAFEQSAGTIPEVRDARGNLLAELPEAVYWRAQSVGEPVDAFYTWSFPSECCKGLLIADVGGLPYAGTLTRWDRNGNEQWAVDIRRNGRNPAQIAVAPDGNVVLRYGHRWETHELVLLDGLSGRVRASRPLDDKARLEHDRALFLVRPAGNGRLATLSVLDPQTLDDSFISIVPEKHLSDVEGPAAETGVVTAKLTNDGKEIRWYALGQGVEPRLLGKGRPRVAGSWVLWSDERGSRVVRSSELLGGAR